MLSLSVRQPYAWLIVNGVKTLDNRSWSTLVRGDILIHAALAPGMSRVDYANLRMDVDNIFGVVMPSDISLMPRGGIVGRVNLIDCVDTVTEACDYDWHVPGMYAFLFSQPVPLQFLSTPGKLRFFEVDYHLP